jgi:hypothetical protein
MPRPLWGATLLVAAIGLTTPSPTLAGQAGLRLYSKKGVAFEPISAADLGRFEAAVARKLDGREIRLISIPGGELPIAIDRGSKSELERLPLHALKVLAGVDCRERPGQEADLLVPVTGEGLLPVTVWCEGRREVVLAFSETPLEVPALVDGVSERIDELSSRFGVGRFVNGEAAWSADELDIAAAAFGTMSAAELRVVAGLPFVRNRTPSQSIEGPHAAYFSLDGTGKAAIVVLDDVFRYRFTSYVGTPETPYPNGALTFLHEVGHAIARASLREEIRDAEAVGVETKVAFEEARTVFDEYALRAEALTAAADEFNARVADFNRLKKKVRRGAAPRAELEALNSELTILQAEVLRLEAEMRPYQARYEELRPELEQLRDQSREQQETVTELAEHNPMLHAYGKLMGAGRGPTAYGATSLDESFAESYALFRLDPAALLRFSPQIHGWFAAGGHMSWVAEADEADEPEAR